MRVDLVATVPLLRHNAKLHAAMPPEAPPEVQMSPKREQWNTVQTQKRRTMESIRSLVPFINDTLPIEMGLWRITFRSWRGWIRNPSG
jgi:hypothetical protein